MHFRRFHREVTTARQTRRTRFILILLGLGAAAVALGGCGSSSTSTSSATASSGNGGSSSEASSIAAATQYATSAMAPAKFNPPGPSFDASAAKGKLVYFIGDENSLPFNALINVGAKAGFAAAGVKVDIPDSEGDVSKMASLIQQGVALHAGLIIVPSVPPQALAAPLAVAKKAGIPVISFFSASARLPTAAEKGLGIDGIVSYNFYLGGKILAAAAIKDSGGHINAVSFWDSDAGSSKAEIDGIAAEFQQVCPSTCKVVFKDIPSFANWAQQVPSLTRTALLNPNVNYFLPIYDGMAQYMLPSIAAATATSRVKIVTLNADIAQMQEMAAHNVIVANVGTPIEYLGWGLADQSLRLLTGQPAVADERVPLRLFTDSNLPNLKEPERDWYGIDFASAYRSLWQVNSN